MDAVDGDIAAVVVLASGPVLEGPLPVVAFPVDGIDVRTRRSEACDVNDTTATAPVGVFTERVPLPIPGTNDCPDVERDIASERRVASESAPDTLLET